MKIYELIVVAFSNKRTYFGFLIVIGLLAFDLFNFATTKTSLESFIGAETILGISIAQALAIAFCAVDLGGLTSLFTSEKGIDEPWWVWMFGAGWLVASLANAALTWWAVLLGIQTAPAIRNPLFTAEQLYTYVPAILAITVWLIRLLLVGTTIIAWDRSDPLPKLKKKALPQSFPQRPPIQKPAPQFIGQMPPKPNGNGALAVSGPATGPNLPT
jgi:hypothetical protein